MNPELKKYKKTLEKIKSLIDKAKNDKSIDLKDLHLEKKYCKIKIKQLTK